MRHLLVFTAIVMCSCDFVWTAPPPEGQDFETPLDGLSGEQLATFAAGDEHFERVFSPAEGLGPRFNESSCAGCHPADGRGTPDQALTRFSRGSDLVYGEGGPQLQEQAVAGVTPQQLPDGVDTSIRMPPPVFGMGLIEAIPEETILELADAEDEDGDGISGRPNMVAAPDWVSGEVVGGGSGLQLGRFGRKASVSSLLEQVARAYQQDMGITSDYLPDENDAAYSVSPVDPGPDPEIPTSVVLENAAYVRLLAPPARGEETEEVLRGEQLFDDSGCADCHVPTLQTGSQEVEPLSEVDVDLYSDLLLHDMGDDLADDRPDGDADGREWRTAPLWGTRLAAEFTGGQAAYLHDGRAATLEEAIEYHGGEASASRTAFEELSADDRRALIAFLESL